LKAHPDLDLECGFQFREFFRFLYVHRQGLFCEYMAACPGGIQSRWIMKIVGQTDMDAVRMDGLQHFPVVGEKRKFRILRAQSLVNIAYCRKLSAGQPLYGFHVNRTNISQADDRGSQHLNSP